jgi:hypothetical protein
MSYFESALTRGNGMEKRVKSVNKVRREILGTVAGAAATVAGTSLLSSCGSPEHSETIVMSGDIEEKNVVTTLADESTGNGQIVSINGAAPTPQAFSNGGSAWVDTNGGYGFKRLAAGGLKASAAASALTAMINTATATLGVTHRIIVDTLPASGVIYIFVAGSNASGKGYVVGGSGYTLRLQRTSGTANWAISLFRNLAAGSINTPGLNLPLSAAGLNIPAAATFVELTFKLTSQGPEFTAKPSGAANAFVVKPATADNTWSGTWFGIGSFVPTSASNSPVFRSIKFGWTSQQTGLSAGDFLYLGAFKIPPVINGANFSYSSGGFCLKVGGSQPEFYVGGFPPLQGNAYAAVCALVKAPISLSLQGSVASLSPAVVLQSTANLLDSPASVIFNTNPAGNSSNGLRINGLGYDSSSGKLLVTVTDFYGAASASEYNGGFFRRSSDLTQTGTTQGPVKLGQLHPRFSPGPLAEIPAALRTAWNSRKWASAGSSGLSVAGTICNGPGLMAFDPADIIAVGTSIPVNNLASYSFPGQTFSEAMGITNAAVFNGVHANHSAYWQWVSHVRGGLQFIEHRNSVIFIGVTGTSRNFYKGDDNFAAYGYSGVNPQPQADISNPSGNAPRGAPYKRTITVVPNSEYAAVAAGSKLPHTVAAISIFNLPEHPFQPKVFSGPNVGQPLPVGTDTVGSWTPVGSAYDPSTKRLYILHGGSGELNGTFGDSVVMVYQIAT